MNKAVALAISISADASGTAAEFDQVGSAALGMADDVDRASRTADDAADRFGSVGDAADELGGKTSQAAGGLGDLGGALAMMPGPLGAVGSGMEAVAPAIMGVTGASDLLNLVTKSNIVMQTRQRAATIASTVATKASAVATRILNAAMRANPIGLVITAVTLLVAGFVLLYKRSETFRAIVQAVGRAGREALGWVVDKARDLWAVIGRVADYVRDRVPAAFKGFRDTVGPIMDKILAPFRSLWDLVTKIVDKIGQIDFPDLSGLPGFGRAAVGGYAGAGRGGGGLNTGKPSLGLAPGVVNNYNIQIYDAFDADATARRLGDLLDSRALRLGTS